MGLLLGLIIVLIAMLVIGVEVKVILNYGQQPELSEWFQLPRDLQQMFR